MKSLIAAAAIAAAGLPAVAADVGVSIGINQPGVYGRVDIGRYPQPVLVAPQPIVVAPVPHRSVEPPVYLWVPPEHRAHWGRYCGRYNACGSPVYFVQDRWYRDQFIAERRHDRHDGWRDERRGDDRRGWRDDRRDDRADDHGGDRRGDQRDDRHGR